MRPHTRNNPDKRQVKSKPTLDEVSDDDTSFQTPDREDYTDYGLEFTTSRLAELNTSPKCSTPRRLAQKDRRYNTNASEDSDNAENQPPATTPLRHTSKKAKKPLRPDAARNTNLPIQRLAPTKTASSRRKQTKPEKRLEKLHREIVCLQQTDQFLIPRLPFSRLVREIMMEHTKTPFFVTKGALEAIQTATEMYLTQRFQDAYLLTQYRSRVTLQVRDMALVAYFCKTYGNL